MRRTLNKFYFYVEIFLKGNMSENQEAYSTNFVCEQYFGIYFKATNKLYVLMAAGRAVSKSMAGKSIR